MYGRVGHAIKSMALMDSNIRLSPTNLTVFTIIRQRCAGIIIMIYVTIESGTQ